MSGLATLASLALVFSELSLLSFGGTNSVLPEMQRQAVYVHGWITDTEFAALFALAQAAPGPNMLVVTLIGWRVAALPGALIATLGVAAPSSVLTYFTAHLWHRFRDASWRRHVQTGLMPVTVGLLMTSAAMLIRTTSAEWGTALVTATATALFLFTRLHPLLVLAGATVLGVLGLV